MVRLNKFIADSGICSRRKADKFINSGLIKVNNEVVTNLGYKISKIHDIVKFNNKILSLEKKTYILLNKPRGYISTTKDEKMRKIVIDLIPKNNYSTRLFPVGRLDRNTVGLLLLTNDGDITRKLLHPSCKVKKIYHVILDKQLSLYDFNIIKNQKIYLDEGCVKITSISFIKNTLYNEIKLEIYIGWNRIIRRLFNQIGYEVIFLDRIYFAGLTKKKLKRGMCRSLTLEEIHNLKML